MRHGYRLVPTKNEYYYNLVCPFGQPIASLEKYASGILIVPLIDGIGDRQDIHLDPSNPRTAQVNQQHPDMQSACQPFVEKHYERTHNLPQRWGAKISGFVANPFWAWLFGIVATVIAIWGIVRLTGSDR